MSNKSNNEIESSIIHLKNYIVHKINDLDQNGESINNNFIDISQSRQKIKNKDSLFNLEKKIFAKFNKKYKMKYSPKRMYNDLIMNTLLFNKNTHLVSVFKDYMIYDYIDEFFKRFYSHFETAERIPKFAVFYKNYLTFFCQPCFANLKFNNLIQKNRERKAELFYNRNFRDKNNKESCEDEGIIEDSDEEDEEVDVGKSKIEQTIFNETVKKKIERYSPINTSMALPDSETKLRDDQSGLLITTENEESLRNILKHMINKKKVKKLKDKFEEEMSSIKKKKTPINDNDSKNNQFFNQNAIDISQNIRNNSKKNTNEQNNSNIINNNNNNNSNNNNNKSKDTKCNSKNDSIINKKNKTNKILITHTQSNINQNGNKKIIYFTKNNIIIDKNVLTSPNNVYSKKKMNNNNENKDKNILKKIENLNLKKTRCNSNRNLNIKEKASSKNANNNIANNARNLSNKNIAHIIKQMKNFNSNKRPPNISIQDDNCNKYNNILTSTNINKNMSEKIIKINSRKFIKQNKSLNNLNNKNIAHGNIIFLKNNHEKKIKNNINYRILYNNSKIKCYSGLYKRTTISQERVKAKLSDELNDILDYPKKIQFQINNRSYSPLNKNKKKSTLNNNSNYSNYLHYQKLIKIKNNHNSSSINNHSVSNNYNNRINCYSLNCRYKNYSSFFLKNNNKNKNEEKNSYINTNNSKKKVNKKDGNKLNINNLIKTQNAEILLHSFKSLNPKVKIRKSKQINTPNENRKKISLASLDNININNPNNNKNIKTNNNEKTNANRISDKLIKKKKNNIIKRVNKINIITTNKRKDINLKGNRTKMPPYEFELNPNKLDKHQKSNSQNNINNIYLFKSNNNKKLMNCNIINFNSNVPNNHGNQRNKNIAKNTRLNSMNITYNQKMSCESSYGNALNSTNINNTTSNNTQKNKNTLFANNKNETETKKSLMTFVVENNNNEKNRISEYRNNKNKYYYKEESSNSSPYKNLKNLNININNQININNNNIINDLMPLNKNSKILEKKNFINKSNKKILLSRNKQNYLDFTSLNSFLSSNSNYSNIRKNYLNKNENPIDVLISSKNLNIKENNKTTLYDNNANKSNNMNNYSYNKSSRKNNSSNIIKKSNMKQNKNDVFKSLKNMTDKIYINLKYKNFSKSRIINQKRESLGKKHLKKSSTYHVLPK